MTRILALLSFLFVGVGAWAHGIGKGDIIIAHPHSPPTIGLARSAVGYLTVMNNEPTADRLVAVQSPLGTASLHQTIVSDGVARMQPIDSIEIPALTQVPFSPGGTHIMFTNLNRRTLAVGDRFEATLVFEKLGPVEVEFWVEPRAGAGAGHSHAGHGS